MNLQFSFRFRTYVLQHTPFSTRSFGKIVGLVPTGYIDPKSGNSLPFLILKKEVFLSSYFRLRINIHSKMNDSVNKLHKFKEKVKKMARLKRFELLTHCLEGSCSIQLSYRRLVGVVRFELTTTRSQSECATRLRYTPRMQILKLI